MANVRIHELAKDMSISSKDLLDKLINLGLPVKNHMSTIPSYEVKRIKNMVLKLDKPQEDSTKKTNESTQIKANQKKEQVADKSQEKNLNKNKPENNIRPQETDNNGKFEDFNYQNSTNNKKTTKASKPNEVGNKKFSGNKNRSKGKNKNKFKNTRDNTKDLIEVKRHVILEDS